MTRFASHLLIQSTAKAISSFLRKRIKSKADGGCTPYPAPFHIITYVLQLLSHHKSKVLNHIKSEPPRYATHDKGVGDSSITPKILRPLKITKVNLFTELKIHSFYLTFYTFMGTHVAMGNFNDDILGLDFAPAQNAFIPMVCVPDDEPLYTVPRQPVTPWPAKLPLELALGGEPTLNTLERYGVTEDDYAKWSLMPAFRRALSEAMKEMREQGLPFKRLCASIAEDFLGELDSKLHDPTIGFALKLDAFKTVTKLGGLEIQPVKEASNQANQVNIQINL